MKELILIGCGGHSKSIIDLIEISKSFKIYGLIGLKSELGKKILGHEVIGTDNDLKKIRTAVKKLGGFLAKNLTDSTTHLIVVEEDLVVTARTVKYFQSILAGMFVVSSRWVFDSFQHEAWLPIANYEVRGDVSCLGGARKSRLLREQSGKSSSLFDSIAVYFLEPFSTFSEFRKT